MTTFKVLGCQIIVLSPGEVASLTGAGDFLSRQGEWFTKHPDPFAATYLGIAGQIIATLLKYGVVR